MQNTHTTTDQIAGQVIITIGKLHLLLPVQNIRRNAKAERKYKTKA